MRELSEYRRVVGRNVIRELHILGGHLKGKSVLNINSTRVGGGVAEILVNLVPLLNQVGVKARWDVISGTPEFFDVTKKFHNALHGRSEDITEEDYHIFEEINRMNLEKMDLSGDIVFIHDPQPIMLIDRRIREQQKWIWRCHIDISQADKELFKFLRRYIIKYDSLVFSSPLFSRKFPKRQFLIAPSIDPLSDKNRDLPEETIAGVLDKHQIDPERPILTQISRFDYLKDPVGVIKTFLLVRKYNDCQLILAGNKAADDPETDKVLAKVREAAGDHPDIHILLIDPENNDIEINALQRASTVIIQKSLREGFGLVVSEALWKARPIVASAVGGIPLQVEHERTGVLCRSIEGAAWGVKRLLNNPEYAAWLGKNGKEHVRQHFLLTRHLRDYLLLFLSLYQKDDIIML
ncbi:MAG: glycosyltransferase [Candidatus Auribacterota bacterium]|nr:glycosyltransferase [Candidatus Auribacterota bacterium]